MKNKQDVNEFVIALKQQLHHQKRRVLVQTHSSLGDTKLKDFKIREAIYI